MAERFAPGDRVRVRLLDPVGHTRAPHYVRGHVGEVVGRRGRHPLPDAVVAGERPEPSAVYAVRFEAASLWGGGEHAVTIDLWDEYLEPSTREAGIGEAGPGQAGPGESSSGGPATAEPGTGQAGTGQAGTGEAGAAKPGSGKPGGWGRTNHDA